MSCPVIRTELPEGLVFARQTPSFTRASVPGSLLSSHSTKAGVWGLIRVLRGRLRYCVDAFPIRTTVVGEKGTAVVEPEVLHHVELLDSDTMFVIEFHRAKVVP
jgi:tellurite resistance-related uncharacterized protein